jgi:hypothetical protein
VSVDSDSTSAGFTAIKTAKWVPIGGKLHSFNPPHPGGSPYHEPNHWVNVDKLVLVLASTGAAAALDRLTSRDESLNGPRIGVMIVFIKLHCLANQCFGTSEAYQLSLYRKLNYLEWTMRR